MLTVIAGTNRRNSTTQRIAEYYLNLFTQQKIEAKYFSLEHLPASFVSPDMYDMPDDEFDRVQQELLIPAEKFVFIVPEYNGSFPGILKIFIDACKIPECFHGKKACLAGVADGRAGNLRGLDHLMAILNHVKINVLYNKVKISQVNKELDGHGQLIKPATVQLIQKQINEFLIF